MYANLLRDSSLASLKLSREFESFHAPLALHRAGHIELPPARNSNPLGPQRRTPCRTMLRWNPLEERRRAPGVGGFQEIGMVSPDFLISSISSISSISFDFLPCPPISPDF